jgi:hypothetical protein
MAHAARTIVRRLGLAVTDNLRVLSVRFELDIRAMVFVSGDSFSLLEGLEACWVIEVSPSTFKARRRQILLVNGFFNAATTYSAI